MCLLFLGLCFKGQVLSFQKQLLMSQDKNHLVQEFFLQMDAFKKEEEFPIIPRFPFENEESCSTKSIHLVLPVSPFICLPIHEGIGRMGGLERKGIGRHGKIFILEAKCAKPQNKNRSILPRDKVQHAARVWVCAGPKERQAGGWKGKKAIWKESARPPSETAFYCPRVNGPK